ncbi:MAG: ABC transporter permease subunit [Pseudomonadota bacterium]
MEREDDPVAEFIDAMRNWSSESAPLDFMLVASHWDWFAQGIVNTVTLTVLALALGACLAMPMAILKAQRVAGARQAVSVFVYIFRGTPLLVQVYIIYYGLAQFEVVRDSIFWPYLREPWWCALLAFTINSAAYQVEIYRGGIDAVPKGEVEAATAVGFSRLGLLRHIVLPSAWRRCFPMWGNETIFLLHGTAVASTITVIDILGAGRQINARYYLAYEGFITATVIYMILIFLLTRVLNRVERQLMRHMREVNTGAAPKAGLPA